MITRSPNQYPIYKTNAEIKPIEKYTVSVIFFDDMLGARNSSQIDDFYTRGRHEELDVNYISQSYFGLLRQSIRKNSDKITLFIQTLGDVQICFFLISELEMCFIRKLRRIVVKLGVRYLTIYVFI